MKLSISRFMRISLWVASLSALSLISTVITHQTAHAATSQSDMTLDERGKSSSYYEALQGCVQNNMLPTIKASSQNFSPTSISWFDDNEAWGYVYPDGKRDCKDIMKSALDIWGMSPKEFLSGIGYEQKSKTSYDWKGQSDGSKRKSGFESYVKSALNTSDPTNPSAAGAYLRYKYWWSKECVVNAFGKYDSITDSVIKQRIDTNYTETVSNSGTYTSVVGKYVKIPLVNGVEWGYFYKSTDKTTSGYSSSSSPYEYTAYGYHTNPRMVSCDDTASKMEADADDYNTYLDEAAVDSICTSKGYSNVSAQPFGQYTLKACISGYKNLGTRNYCENTYKPLQYNYYGTTITNSQENELAACKVGASITPDEIKAARDGIVAQNQADAGGGAVGEGKTTCVIEAVGWIVCPVVNFLANISDGAFVFLSNSFLFVNPQAFNIDQPIYKAWTVMRNLANIAFVIIFIIIIFSQLTGTGVSNYGVKKMLPRLVVAAILVNLSFFITQLAVDISNIAGYSLRDVFNGITTSVVKTSSVQDIVNNGSPFANGQGFAGIAGGILAAGITGVALYALISTLIPVLLAAVLALVMILFILVARQAIIILLVVVSPLAFVAFLLPNTEKLFKMWRKMLTAMLLLFPIVAVIFGASALASQILTSTFTGGSIPGDSSNWFGQLIGAAVLVLPLFAVPIVLRKSLDGIPMIGQLASRWSGKANARLGSKVKDSYRGSLLGRGSAIRKQARDNYRSRKFAERVNKGGLNQVLASGVPIMPADRYANKALARSAEEGANEALSKDVSAAGRSMEGQVSREETRKIALGLEGKSLDGRKTFKGSDVATRMASIDKVVASNDIKGMNDLWEASQSWQGQEGDKLRSHLANRIQSSGSKPAYFGAGTLEQLRTGEHKGTSARQLMSNAVAADAYSPEKVASADKDELAAVYNADRERAAEDATYAVSHGTKLQSASTAALSDPQLNRTISKNRENVTRIASGVPGGGPSNPT